MIPPNRRPTMSAPAGQGLDGVDGLAVGLEVMERREVFHFARYVMIDYSIFFQRNNGASINLVF